MLTKFELRKYKHLKAEMLELQERINEITSVMRAPKIPRLSGTPGGGGGNSDKLCDTIDKLDKLRTMYYQKLGVLADLQLTIEKRLISCLLMRKCLYAYTISVTTPGNRWQQERD